ncbi:MAG TPA: hypothetical protein VII69_04490 [Candidatus Eremiobacteraceae bacterium]
MPVPAGAQSNKSLSRIAPAAFLVAVVVLASLAAAAATHSAIDLIGDFALPRDSYDGMAHESRALAFVLVLVIAIAGVLRFLWSALDGSHASATAFRALAQPVLALPVWRFAATVMVLALIALMAMESMDALLDGVRIDDFADVLGGSIPLGSGVTLAISACIGAAVSQLLRALAAAHEAIIEIVCAILIGARHPGGSPRGIRTALSLESFAAPISILSTRAGKRAPPLLFV